MCRQWGSLPGPIRYQSRRDSTFGISCALLGARADYEVDAEIEDRSIVAGAPQGARAGKFAFTEGGLHRGSRPGWSRYNSFVHRAGHGAASEW